MAACRRRVLYFLQKILFLIILFSYIKADSPRLANQGVKPMGMNMNVKPQVPVERPKGQPKPSKIKISTSDECSADVEKFCSKGVRDNNFSILDCLQADDRTNGEVSDACQHFLWQYKQDLTKDDRFDTAVHEVCSKELSKIPECQRLKPGEGEIIPCLIENSENITTPSCQKFLNKMASIIFSDYRLIYHFIENCGPDIEKFQCGRLDREKDDSPHSQGQTVACLAEHSKELFPQCKKQVLRVYELQSDDFHMDRPLYYACREDREMFCADVTAGNGAVFQCLFDHLGANDLSAECRKQLELRQRLMAEDVRVDHTFYSKCLPDIQAFHCLGGSVGHEDAKRAHVLLCLENAHMNEEKKVSGACIQEMMKVRQRLMADYRISPDLMARCSDEIEQHCEHGLKVGGETLHCLMDLARHRKKHDLIRDSCKAQLGVLLKEINAAEDYRIDRALQLACSSVVTEFCSHIPELGSGKIISCLMDNIDEDEMTDECEKRLLEIQYFVARDFKLDPDLYKTCKKDARQICKTNENWADPDKATADQGPLVLSCLHRSYRHRTADSKDPPVSRACINAIQRVMRQRTSRVGLHPEIEDVCMKELGDFCSEDKEDMKKGAELECLQLNFENLSENCKQIIGDLTDDARMDGILMKSCTPMIKKFCDEELEADTDVDDVLQCLIEHKNHPEMRPKCAAGIEHHQLISLKNFKFNHRFKEACHKSVQELCPDRVTKYDVVSCLSEHVRNDTLLDRDHRVDSNCRKQLKVELLERGENIKLDPELESECKDDINRLCANVSPGNAAVLECLKERKQKLSSSCHKLLFKREKDEFAIADYALLHTCKKMIRKFCDIRDSEPEILDCLKKAKDDGDDFDDKCRRIVLQRQITQARDYRLNPLLQTGCHQDIPKFCADVMKNENNDIQLEGKVINCLKKQFAIKRLSSTCEQQIRERVKAAAQDIRQAPVLLKACEIEISQLCQKDIMSAEDGVKQMEISEAGQGRVIECLKSKFLEHKINTVECRREIASMLAESQIDVNVDPLLHTTCQQDITSLCIGVRAGQGRQMACLLATLDDNPDAMTVQCREMLKKRKEMWEYAAQVAPPENFHEIYESIMTSPSKTYFLAILFTVIGLIFIVGISCGRVTKRVRAELKNK